MKKTTILLSIILLSLSTGYASKIRRKIPLKTLHNWARGYRVVNKEVKTRKGRPPKSREKMIAVNYATRRRAIYKIMQRKNEKSITVLAELSAEGLNTRFSPKGIPGAGRERISAVARTKIRYLSLYALLKFKGSEKNNEQKRLIKEALRAVILEGYSDRNIALACQVLGAYEKIFTDKEKKYFIEYFRRQAFRVVKRRQIRLLLGMFIAVEKMNIKEGISFLDRAIRAGLRGRLYIRAVKIKRKLLTSRG